MVITLLCSALLRPEKMPDASWMSTWQGMKGREIPSSPNNNQRPQGNAVAQQPAAPPASANATQSTDEEQTVEWHLSMLWKPTLLLDMNVARAPEHSDERISIR